MKITMSSNKSSRTVEDVFDRFIRKCKVKNLSVRTIQSYEEKIETFYKFYDKGNPIDGITANTIDDYILWLRENSRCNDVSINSHLRSLRSFLYYAMDNEGLRPFRVRLIKTEKKIKQTYSDTDLEKLLKRPNTLKCTFSEYKTWAFENYLLGTGNRISTALNVRICDIDFENALIVLKKTKNRRQQTIPLSSTLEGILREYIEVRGGDPDDVLFCNEYGGAASVRSYQQLVRRYNIRHGVEVTSAHAFRHTFATRWILNNGNVAQLSRILGHSSIAVTNEYLQMSGTDLAPDFDKFNPLDTLNKGDKK